METSVAIAKEADAKKGFSHTMSDNIIHRAQNEPEMQLGSLRGVIGNIRSNGSTPSVDSIATQLSSMHTAQRAPVLSALQQTHGNQYVQRVVAEIQAKLAVGQPGDKYEQEADRVAEQVMRMPDSQIMSREDIPKIVRKRSIANSPEVHPDIESEINTQQGNGQPLPDHTRTFFEPRFGYDFGGVRIHTDAHADKFNRALGARAFTLNQDIYISKQDANLNSQEGQRLLAHELTHVVQQEKNYSARKYQPIQSSIGSFGESVTARESMVPPSLVGCIIQREEGDSAPAASLSGLRATRTAFNNTGAPNSDNCATSQPASLGVGIGGNAQNAMEIIYRISGTIPAGTEFDITRTVTDTSWERDAANAWTRILHTPAGTKDDYHDDDECLRPNARRIFVTDSPGFNGLNPRGLNLGGGVSVSGSATAFAIKLRFAEWVIARNRRLGIGWTRISQPCFTFWHSITSVALVGGTWHLVNTPSGDSNEIELGSISTAGATP